MATALPRINGSRSHGLGWLDGLPEVVAACAVGLMTAIGLLLAVRQATGALTREASLADTLVLATTATAVAAYARVVFRPETHPPRLVRAVGYGTSLSLVLLVVGCWPFDKVFGGLVWIPLLVADQFWRQHFLDRIAAGETNEPRGEAPLSAATSFASVIEAEAAPEEPTVLQRVFRVRDASGSEVAYATVAAEFETGQRSATVFVAFCPPLASEPRLEADPIEFAEARVGKVTAYAHGAQLEVKLSEPAEEPCRVWVDLAATPQG